ncbi:MAG: DUF4981 domain-containing protein, partial [Vallitaleaceae bacterium]|nr:DUF4981 domain-containing protein [Vallitaleaceae bacterium]
EFKTSDFFSVPTSNLAWMDAIGNKQIIGKKLLRPMQKDGESKVKTIEPLDYENKPAFLSAYAPNHENGLGDIKVYMDQFEKYDNWCGGFIYDFVDQAIRRKIDGQEQWLYGGDFGEAKTSGYLCATGMVASDRSLHPAAHEIKKIYQNYEIQGGDLENFHVTFSKKSPFDDPNLYGVRWELLEDGETLQRGEQDLLVFEDCKSQTVALEVDGVDKIDGAEYHLNMSMHLKQPTLWGEEDHVVAWEQLKMTHQKRPHTKHVSSKELAIHDRKIKTEITGDGFSIMISKLTGDITSIVYDKKEYILAPLKLNFYRVPTDNDLETQREYKRKYKTRINWKKVSESYQVQKVSIENLKSEVIIQVHRKVKYIKKSLITEYVIDGSGNLFVSHQMTPKRNLMKFGTSMDISDEFSTLSWFGKGLQENYCDRQSGAKVGVYSCHVNDYVHNYLRPQENSNRTDIRWFSATTEGGEGLYFEDVEGTLLNMSAWPYTLKNLEEADHIHALRPKNTITLNIDYKQKGVGSEDENGAGLSDEHKLLKNRQYKYGYKICRAY